ncbi:MAG: cobalamin-dependent protein [Deltaproteobacteria bacterium]|jgi:5-methyltetrahydrofolate--homocysteine methyltransferase|nr:cobalamin-dependent protein [Deltaproteobacteria bacterium]
MQELLNAVVELMEDEALALTKEYMEKGKSANEVFDVYKAALAEIGARFEKKEYFVPELILSGELIKAGSEIIKPYLTTGENSSGKPKLGKALIATVEGDIHDIGKNIAGMMMDIAGLEVMDLGVDVATDKIVNEAISWQPDIIGLSGLLTLAYDPMKMVVEGLKKEGLRDKIKVIIGGGQTDEHVRKYVGADIFATDAMVNVTFAQQVLGGR